MKRTLQLSFAVNNLFPSLPSLTGCNEKLYELNYGHGPFPYKDPHQNGPYIWFQYLTVYTWMQWKPHVVVVLLFPANNTAMESYNIIQNKLLDATREAIRLIGLEALIMANRVNKCMWPTGVRGQGWDRGMHHGTKRTCRFRGVGSVLIIIKQVSRDWLGLHDRLLRHSLVFVQVILS